jgi:hypothetical protein
VEYFEVLADHVFKWPVDLLSNLFERENLVEASSPQADSLKACTDCIYAPVMHEK